MGLDVILGVMVLLTAVRGWFQGFVLQAIRIGGLVACVYEAGPIRDLARPHVQGYLTGLRPELLDRLLWWASCALGYVVTVGAATMIVRLQRRKSFGEPDPYRGNQAAGLLLGMAKGFVVVAFLVAAIDRYLPEQFGRIDWAAGQLEHSQALSWAREHRPADRIWSTPAVQTFVAYVREMGLNRPDESGPDLEPPQIPATAAQTPESRPDALQVPRRPGGTRQPALDPELDAIRRDLLRFDRAD